VVAQAANFWRRAGGARLRRARSHRLHRQSKLPKAALIAGGPRQSAAKELGAKETVPQAVRRLCVSHYDQASLKTEDRAEFEKRLAALMKRRVAASAWHVATSMHRSMVSYNHAAHESARGVCLLPSADSSSRPALISASSIRGFSCQRTCTTTVPDGSNGQGQTRSPDRWAVPKPRLSHRPRVRRSERLRSVYVSSWTILRGCIGCGYRLQDRRLANKQSKPAS